jgi:hypothetical protein
MRPGGRDVLIELFERAFVEGQEAVGAHVVGTFRDLDRPDRFVWLRSFADMETRARALDGFYSGPVWQAHRSAANATMIDSDDVLLLRPVAGSLLATGLRRPPIGAREIPDALIVVVTYFLSGNERAFAYGFEAAIEPQVRLSGGRLLATFATEHSPNTYPRLPVREGETVFVAIARYPSEAAFSAWPNDAALEAACIAPTHIMRLKATPRSLLR